MEYGGVFSVIFFFWKICIKINKSIQDGMWTKRYIKITTTHSQVLILFGVGNLLSLFTSLSSLKCMHIFTYAMHISHLASRSKEGRILQRWKNCVTQSARFFLPGTSSAVREITRFIIGPRPLAGVPFEALCSVPCMWWRIANLPTVLEGSRAGRQGWVLNPSRKWFV